MTPAFYLRHSLRELRGAVGRLFYFVACLAVGVAAVVTVGGLSRGLDSGIRAEAKQLLAADLAIEGRQPPPPSIVSAVAQIEGARYARIRELVTVVSVSQRRGEGPRSLLTEVKVVEGPYPFYGELELEPAGGLDQLLDAHRIVVAPDLLPRLGLRVGDVLLVGGEPFTISGVVHSEPDRLSGAFTLGPRVFLSREGLERASLTGMGSRVEHRLLVKLPHATSPDKLRETASRLEAALGDKQGLEVETYTEAQPSLRRGLSRLESYLALVALLSLLVGGVGVGQAMRTWIGSRMDAIAVLKCVGVRPREVLWIYLGQAFGIGLLGSLVGCVLGAVVLLLVPQALGDLLPSRLLQPWQPQGFLRGLVLGLGVTMLFSLLPLSQVLRIPPARVLRRDAEPLPASRSLRLLSGVTLILGIGALALTQAGSARLALQFTGGVLATTLALSGAAFALTRAARRVPRDGGHVWLRYGLASLARPGTSTLGAIVALGLGLLVVFATSQVERHLQDQLREELPEDAPSVFFIDVQPDQWQEVDRMLRSRGAARVQSVPVVMARLRKIDGFPVSELAERAGGGERRWALTREQRLTYVEELPEDNRILAGALWSDPGRFEMSIEEEFAKDLGVQLGSTLEFDLQGVPMSFVVSSIRSVDWETFEINFFLIAEPGSLEDAPQQRLATARLPAGTEQAMQDLIVERFPNITVVMVRQLLEKVTELLRRLGWGISFLGAFTLTAGLAILAATIGVESVRRGREVALLKTLGMKRRGVAALFATEYALVGLVAGVIGCSGGGLIAWLVLRQGMELPWRFYPLAWGQAAATSVLLALFAGVGASLGALRRRPLEVLREE